MALHPEPLSDPAPAMTSPPATATRYAPASVTPARSRAISSAITQVHKEHVGRGPDLIRTRIFPDLVVCLLHGGFTQAEQTLARHDHHDLITAGRDRLNDTMHDALIDIVAHTLDRRVRSVMHGLDLTHGLQAHMFVLDCGVDRRD